MLKICNYCQKEFQSKEDKRVRFCSLDCRRNWHNKNKNIEKNRAYQLHYYQSHATEIADKEHKKRLNKRQQKKCRICNEPCLNMRFKNHCSETCVLETRKKYDANWKRARAKQFHDFKLIRGCDKCGYKKSAYALDFHHPNKNKESQVSALRNCSWDKILSEVTKCELVCKNCHAEEHERLGGYYIYNRST